MIEDSPEQFVREWAAYANEVEIFPHPDNTPLIEVRLATGKVIHLFDRSGPYTMQPGLSEVLMNPMITEFTLSTDEPVVHEAKQGTLHVVGEVDRVAGRTFGLRAGAVSLAVSVLGSELPAVGQRVQFESVPGVHAFVVAVYMRRFGTHRPAQ